MLSIYKKEFTENLCLNYCNGIESDGIKGMVQWIAKRIAKYLSDDKIVGRQDLQSLRDLLTNEKIFEILSSKPENMITIWTKDFEVFRHTQLTYTYLNNNVNKQKTVKILYHIFNYDSFRDCKDMKQFRGYLLADKLGIDCCPYCNRNYTTTHTQDYIFINGNNKEVFPSFDHFYPKGLYPILATSFYNLIPSCNICNSDYKGEKDTNDEQYRIFHPYSKIDNNHFSFEFLPKDYESLVGKAKNIDLNIVCFNNDVKKSFDKSIIFFGVKENYQNNHLDLVEDIIDKKITFSNKYLAELQSVFGLNFKETYKIIFETHYEEDKLHKRPFSKLKKDIFDDVNIKTKL